MSLDPASFRHVERLAKGDQKRVRTPKGARYFGLPIGAVIPPGYLRQHHGGKAAVRPGAPTHDAPRMGGSADPVRRVAAMQAAAAKPTVMAPNAESPSLPSQTATVTGIKRYRSGTRSPELVTVKFDKGRNYLTHMSDVPWEDLTGKEITVYVHRNRIIRVEHEGKVYERYSINKARKVVDGDGDGWVYDGTPRKRPATPAEMAAGRALRARANARGGPVGGAAKKAAAPKRSPRYQKYDRAINQAIKRGDKFDLKNLPLWIRGDLDLKPEEKRELLENFKRRRDGRPDVNAPAAPAKKAPAKPAAKKVVPEVPEKPPEKAPEKAPAKKVPVKAAAGKKAPPKKAPPAKKAATPKEPSPETRPQRTGVETLRFEQIDRQAKAGNTKALRDLHVLVHHDFQQGKINDKQHREIRAEIDRRLLDIELKQKRDKENAAEEDFRREMNDQFRKTKNVSRLKDIFRRQIDNHPDLGPEAKNDLLNHMNLRVAEARARIAGEKKSEPSIMQRIQRIGEAAGLRRKNTDSFWREHMGGGEPPAKKAAPRRPAVPRDKTVTPKGGARTKAWMKLLQRSQDRGNAQRREQQIVNAKNRGRIGTGTGERLFQRGKEKDRQRQAAAQKAAASQVQRQRANAEANRIINEMHGAKSVTEMEAIKNQIGEPTMAFLQQHGQLERVNRAIDAHLNRIIQQRREQGLGRQPRRQPKSPTVEPRKPPGEARARAKAAGAGADARGLSADIKSATNIPDLDAIIDRLEADPGLNDEEHNRIVGLIAARKMAIKGDPEYVKAKAFYSSTKDVQAAMEHAFSEQQLDALLAVALDFKDSDADGLAKRAAQVYGEVTKRLDKLKAENRKIGAADTFSDHDTDNSIEALHALTTHFEGGGKIADAPNNGLWNYLQAQNGSGRFTVKAKGADGITPKYVITDRETGETWWAKGDRGQHFTPLGGVKEMWGAEMLAQMGVGAPPVKLGQNANADDIDNQQGKFFLQQDYGQWIGDDRKVDGGHNGAADINNVLNGPDPAAYIRLSLLDYVTGNGDRHGGNFIGQGDRLGYLDFGLGFGYWGISYQFSKFSDNDAGHNTRGGWRYVKAAMRADSAAREHIQQIKDELARIKPRVIQRMAEDQGMDPGLADQWADVVQRKIDDLMRLSPDHIHDIMMAR